MDEQYYKWHKLSERKPTKEDADENGNVAVVNPMCFMQVTKHYTALCLFPNNHDPEKTHWWPMARPPLPEKTQAEADIEAAVDILREGRYLHLSEYVKDGITYGRAEERKRLAKEIMEHIDTKVENARVSRGIFVSLIEINDYLKTFIHPYE